MPGENPGNDLREIQGSEKKLRERFADRCGKGARTVDSEHLVAVATLHEARRGVEAEEGGAAPAAAQVAAQAARRAHALLPFGWFVCVCVGGMNPRQKRQL